jgi:hypothetical protein
VVALGLVTITSSRATAPVTFALDHDVRGGAAISRRLSFVSSTVLVEALRVRRRSILFVTTFSNTLRKRSLAEGAVTALGKSRIIETVAFERQPAKME